MVDFKVKGGYFSAKKGEAYMKKVALVLSAVILSVSLIGCSTYHPVSATSNSLGSKTGESSRLYIFGFIPTGGENTISAAAKDGGITKISTVDFKWTWYVLAVKHETIVTGE